MIYVAFVIGVLAALAIGCGYGQEMAREEVADLKREVLHWRRMAKRRAYK